MLATNKWTKKQIPACARRPEAQTHSRRWAPLSLQMYLRLVQPMIITTTAASTMTKCATINTTTINTGTNLTTDPTFLVLLHYLLLLPAPRFLRRLLLRLPRVLLRSPISLTRHLQQVLLKRLRRLLPASL